MPSRHVGDVDRRSGDINDGTRPIVLIGGFMSLLVYRVLAVPVAGYLNIYRTGDGSKAMFKAREKIEFDASIARME